MRVGEQPLERFELKHRSGGQGRQRRLIAEVRVDRAAALHRQVEIAGRLAAMKQDEGAHRARRGATLKFGERRRAGRKTGIEQPGLIGAGR